MDWGKTGEKNPLYYVICLKDVTAHVESSSVGSHYLQGKAQLSVHEARDLIACSCLSF